MPKLTLYHGSNHKIEKFEIRDGDIMQDGPGIYLTSDIKDASHYGKIIHEVEFKYTSLVSTKPGSQKRIQDVYTKVLRTLKLAPDWQDSAQNWDENPEKGIRIAASNYLDVSDSAHELYQNIWGDFYKNNPIEFCNIMARKGYDGVLIEKNNVKHAIVYNPNSLKIKNVMINESKKKQLKEVVDENPFSFQTIVKGPDLDLWGIESVLNLPNDEFDVDNKTISIMWFLHLETKSMGINGMDINIHPKIVEGELSIWDDTSNNSYKPFSIDVSDYEIVNNLQFSSHGTLYINNVEVDFNNKVITVQ